MDNKDKETLSLNAIIVKYLLHWKLFLAVFIFSFIPAIIYLKIVPRTYEFNASILLQEEKESAMSSMSFGSASNLMKSFGIGPSGGNGINVDDQIEILSSNRIQRLMILDLGVNIIYYKPYSLYNMYREAPLILTVDSATMANLHDEVDFYVSVTPGNISVKASTLLGKREETFNFSSLPATLKIGSDDYILDFDHDDDRKKSFKLKIRCLPAGWMAENLSKRIKVEDVSSSSNVLLLSYQDHSMQRGLDVLNTLIQVYNDDMSSFQRSEDRKKMQYVDSRISDILANLEKVENDLKEFKKKNEMTLLEADVTLYGESYKELQLALIETEMQAHQINLMDDFLKDPGNIYKTIPSVFTVDEGEKGVVSQYNKAVAGREKLLFNSNEQNSLVQTASHEVAILREGVNTMIDNARKSVTKALGDLKSKESQLLSKFKSVPEKEREYVSFVRDQEILNGVYFLMLQKREETLISLSKETDLARMIEPPYIKKKPLGPRKLYAGIGILAFTLVVPVSYLFIKNLLLSIKNELRSAKQ